MHDFNSSQQVLLTCFDIFVFTFLIFACNLFSPLLFLILYFTTNSSLQALSSQVLFCVLRSLECDVFKT